MVEVPRAAERQLTVSYLGCYLSLHDLHPTLATPWPFPCKTTAPLPSLRLRRSPPPRAYLIITCSTVILYADWSIGVRSGPFTLCRFNIVCRIQYYHLATSLVLISKVILRFYEMYLYFFLSMKEQVIHSLRSVGKCNPACYPPLVIQIPRGGAEWDLDDFEWISGRIALSNRAYR